MRNRRPAFNTTQVRRSRYKKPLLSKTTSGQLGRARSSSDGVGVPFSLKEILSDSSRDGISKSEEKKEAKEVVVKDSEELQAVSASQLSELHVGDKERAPIDEVSHIRDLGSAILWQGGGNDEILQYITSQRSSIGEETMPRRESNSEEAMARATSHIAGVKDLKVFSQKSQLEKTASFSVNDFIYALARTSSKGNPYELYIVEAEKARAQEVYFTISAFNVSQVNSSFL